MARNDPQVNFRIPVELKQRLEAAAEKNNRSFKAEVEYRLDNWEQAIDQIDLTHEGWEIDRLRLEQLNEQVDGLRIELGEANTRCENLEERYHEYRDEMARILAEAHSKSLPASLLRRVELRASKTGRTSEEEIVLALEHAFPPPALTQSAARFLNLEMIVLQWHSSDWHLVDWDTWGRFRSGDNSTVISNRRDDEISSFVVIVIDDAAGLTNVVSHNYRITEDGYRSTLLEYLSESEGEEYKRLMTASAATKDDETRLSELQDKMAPASLLPQKSISRLREILGQIAGDEIIERLLSTRGLIA